MGKAGGGRLVAGECLCENHSGACSCAIHSSIFILNIFQRMLPKHCAVLFCADLHFAAAVRHCLLHSRANSWLVRGTTGAAAGMECSSCCAPALLRDAVSLASGPQDPCSCLGSRCQAGSKRPVGVRRAARLPSMGSNRGVCTLFSTLKDLPAEAWLPGACSGFRWATDTCGTAAATARNLISELQEGI